MNLQWDRCSTIFEKVQVHIPNNVIFTYCRKSTITDNKKQIFKLLNKSIVSQLNNKHEMGKLLNDPLNIWDLWNDDNSCKCNLTLWQKGAGNGKTYGLWEQNARVANCYPRVLRPRTIWFYHLEGIFKAFPRVYQ